MGGLCANCGKRPATIDWVGNGGALAISHGVYERWCEVCALTAQLEHAQKMAGRIPDLERRLAEVWRR
jgi:hypothetical protein